VNVLECGVDGEGRPLYRLQAEALIRGSFVFGGRLLCFSGISFPESIFPKGVKRHQREAALPTAPISWLSGISFPESIFPKGGEKHQREAGSFAARLLFLAFWNQFPTISKSPRGEKHQREGAEAPILGGVTDQTSSLSVKRCLQRELCRKSGEIGSEKFCPTMEEPEDDRAAKMIHYAGGAKKGMYTELFHSHFFCLKE
jgi:hypothetical protein